MVMVFCEEYNFYLFTSYLLDSFLLIPFRFLGKVSLSEALMFCL